MDGSRLEITSKGLHAAGGTTVRLDGQEIQNCLRGINLSMSVDEITTAMLDVRVYDTTEVEAEVSAYIPEETRELLIRLGWTPPEAPSPA